MAADVRVVLNLAEIAALGRSPEMGRALVEAAQPGIRAAQSAAPHLTGAGAASIHAEAILDGPEMTARVSWDRLHYYMRFHQMGTKYMPARPFLVQGFK